MKSKAICYPCPRCGGTVTATRKVTLAEAVEHHQPSCPSVAPRERTKK